MDLIFCRDGNPQMAEIAIKQGFKYGARMPGTVHFPIYFADQDYKNPDKVKYIACLAEHKPHMATVLDYDEATTLTEVLAWAEEAAQYVQEIVIIPKIPGTINQLPDKVGAKQVILGYSVPTTYGGTVCEVAEFGDRPVHLLGGAPHVQMELYVQFPNVRSVDGNMISKLAIQRGQFWVPGTARYAKNRFYPQLKEYLGKPYEGENMYLEAFRLSCQNVWEGWQRVLAGDMDYVKSLKRRKYVRKAKK